MSITDFQENYRGKKDSKNAVQSTQGAGHKYTYKPGSKDEREARRHLHTRFIAMRDSQHRKDAERRWDLGDKLYRMWAPERDPDDWRADIILPDGFSAVQTHMQETVTLRPRPQLEGVESSDDTLEAYVNHIYQFAMDKTDFDIETYKARNCSAIRGDAFTIEEYRLETREVQDPIEVDENGEIKYKKRKITDYDDVYTRQVDNWSVYFDDSVEDPKYGRDCIYREVLDHEDFVSMYSDKAGFTNTDKVVPAKSLNPQAGFFQKAEDVGDNDVEILHYWNKITDSYDVLANNVLIRRGPLPSRHKELPIDKWTFYPIPGLIYGLGIPQIIYSLVEERRSGRNMGLDRNKMGLAKMFLVNDLFDLDEDDLTPRPHGMIKVNTNGLPMQQAIQPLEYGDVPMSAIRMDDTLLTDERRAHGLDDRPAQTAGGTATESAIISEAAQKRINLINTLQNWQTLQRLGRKKWSNIQFFYPAPRMEEVMEDNKWKEKKVYRSIKIEGREFKVKGDPDKSKDVRLVMAPFEGSSRVKLEPTYARFLEGNYDIVVDASNNIVESRAVKFGRAKEIFEAFSNNPVTARWVDGQKSVRRLYMLAGEQPKDWMAGEGMTDSEMMALAEQENALIAGMEESGKIFMLPGTPGANEAHTMVHLNFANSPAFEKLSEAVQDVLTNHVMEEHQKNPGTGALAEKMKELGIGGPTGAAGPEMPMPPGLEGPPQGGGGNVVPPGQPGGPGIEAPPVPGGVAAGGDVTNAIVA